MTRLDLIRMVGWRSMLDPTISVVQRVEAATVRDPIARRDAIRSVRDLGMERVPLAAWIGMAGTFSAIWSTMFPLHFTSFVVAACSTVSILTTLRADRYRTARLDVALAEPMPLPRELGSGMDFMGSLAGLGLCVPGTAAAKDTWQQ